MLRSRGLQLALNGNQGVSQLLSGGGSSCFRKKDNSWWLNGSQGEL
jgi:hypothetical protein